MSTFKNLKALFFVAEPEAPAVQTLVNPGVPAPNVQPTNINPAANSVANSDVKTGVDAQIIETLQKALDAHNQPGYDYLEYRQGTVALQNMIADTATRYRSVFAAAVPMGASKAALVSSAVHYKKVLENQKTEFEQALNGQIDRNLTQKKQQIIELQNQMEAKKQQIEQINKEIISLQTQIQESQAGISGSEAKINATRSNFDLAYNVVVSGIDQDINHINTYLQG